MSYPQPVPQRRTPPRAEPLQPDKPGGGNDREISDEPDHSTDPATRSGHDPAAEKLGKQSHEALKNVSTGYD